MNEPTSFVSFQDATGRASPTHCRIAGWASGSQFTLELSTLLLSRLRVVALIAFTPLALFLLLLFTNADRYAAADSISLALHTGVTVIILGFAVLLWTVRGLSYCNLRRIELALFSSLALFFSWLQIHLLEHDRLPTAATEDTLEVVRLWIDNSALRWFFLIVIYGVFIPNTWKRCAMLTGVTALLPLALTPLGATLHNRLCPGVTNGMLDLCIVIGTAWAVAVFGTYRLQVLEQEAFRARRLGQYQLGNRLGAGGMGEVYEAEHVLLRRRCALKLIRTDQMQDASALTRFEREVRAMATLTHWNTVEVYDYGRSEDGTFYYVMEFLRGLTLETLVNRHGVMPPARVIHLLRQICAALREAHAIGLLHRDIKPGNIMACQLGGLHDVVKLLDFGLVQQRQPNPEALRLTTQGAILGSPPYMSPEQAIGRLDLDGRTDIYSVGGVAYFLLTGQPPYVRETPMEMMLAHVYEPVVPPSRIRPGMPEDLQNVILRCLQKKAADRFPTVEALDAALAACCITDSWDESQAALWWDGVSIIEDTAHATVPTIVTAERAGSPA